MALRLQYKVMRTLIRRHIPCRVVNGWSLTTYDNHDRSKVLLQGEQLINIEQLTHIPARVHHILSQTLATEDTLNALYSPLPPYTVDFHLINLICAEFTLPFQLSDCLAQACLRINKKFDPFHSIAIPYFFTLSSTFLNWNWRILRSPTQACLYMYWIHPLF
jgi:hypothetical protein